MSAVAEAGAAGRSAATDRAWLGWLAGAARFWVGVLFCLTPPTAVLVLGWLTRLTAFEARAATDRLSGARIPRPDLPHWLVAEDVAPGLDRWIRAFRANLIAGLRALVMFGLAAAPFAALWLLSWWAGWENSFNKGYEQAWVGPSLGLLGVAIALPLLARLPMALAHHAVQGRLGAAWDAEIGPLIRAAGWRYVLLSAGFALAALPLFAAQALPVFVEAWSPGFAERNAERVQEFRGLYRLVVAAYLLFAAITLRRWLGRLYAQAARRRATEPPARGPAALLGRLLRGLALGVVWFALVAQIFVAQFLNHGWTQWLNHPLLGLPLATPLGG